MEQIRPEARIAAQERYSQHLAGRIEEVAQDLRKLDQDKTSFDEVHEYLKTQDARFARVETRLDSIEVTMATKEDIARVDERIAKVEKRLDEHGELLRQILNKLS